MTQRSVFVVDPLIIYGYLAPFGLCATVYKVPVGSQKLQNNLYPAHRTTSQAASHHYSPLSIMPPILQNSNTLGGILESASTAVCWCSNLASEPFIYVGAAFTFRESFTRVLDSRIPLTPR